MAEYVYVIQAGGKCKVGLSKSPKDRFIGMKTSIPGKSDLLVTLKCATRQQAANLESNLHKRLDSKKSNGEWFNISIQDVVAMIMELKTPVEINCYDFEEARRESTINIHKIESSSVDLIELMVRISSLEEEVERLKSLISKKTIGIKTKTRNAILINELMKRNNEPIKGQELSRLLKIKNRSTAHEYLNNIRSDKRFKIEKVDGINHISLSN